MHVKYPCLEDLASEIWVRQAGYLLTILKFWNSKFKGLKYLSVLGFIIFFQVLHYFICSLAAL